jgi:hypothetical protein
MLFIQFNVRPSAFLKFCALTVPGPGGEKLVGGVSSEGGFGFHHFPGHAAILFIQFNVRPAAFLKFCALTVPGPGGEKLVSSEGFGFHHFPGHGGGWPAGHFPGTVGSAGYQAWHPGEYSGQHQVFLSSHADLYRYDTSGTHPSFKCRNSLKIFPETLL